LGLPEPRGWKEGVAALADWLRAERGLPATRELVGGEA
jgi:hypothetical protein